MNTLYLWMCIFAAGFGAARGWFECPVLASRKQRVVETVLATICLFCAWPIAVAMLVVNNIPDSYYGDNQ